MSSGGLNINVAEPKKKGSVNSSSKKKQPEMVKKNFLDNKVVPLDEVTALINPEKCINCGICRDNCPVNAIKENQRIICHSCSVCTEKPGFSPTRSEELATECSCTTACPLQVSPQGYIGLAKLGLYHEAFDTIWAKNPLPAVCGSVCHHPCEDACKRGIIVDSPIKIRDIKKYLAVSEEANVKKYKPIYDETVAVIGAGPAGLTAGHYLASMGYEVTVFEGSNEAGGMLKQGIPEFRLDRELIDQDIKRLTDAGLDIRLGFRIDKYMMEEIRNEYDIVIVAAGTPTSKELKIPGWRLAGVMPAVSFMQQVNNGAQLRRHLGQIFEFDGGEAVVIGGGSVAMDVARTAKRVGASKVTVVALECGEEFPAHHWEKAEAIEEGIVIIEGYSPIEFMTDLFPRINGVKFAKVTSFKKDVDGKINFTIDETAAMEVRADWVVQAIGQSADDLWNDYSDAKDVIFAGDIASNKCSVVDAMASGRKAAIDADALLRGREMKNDLASHELELAPVMQRIYPYNRRKVIRPTVDTLAPEERLNSFDEVVGILTEEQLLTEAVSCLACGYEVVDSKECVACGVCQKLCPKGDVITMVAKGGTK